MNADNAHPRPLAAYYFGNDPARQQAFLDRTTSGAAVINDVMTHAVVESVPFGGVRPSGMGAYHGKYGFLEFSHSKSVMTKPTRPDLSKLTYPPYTDKAWKIARKFF